MIHVQVAPAEPLPFGEVSKHRVGMELKISGRRGESLDQDKELLEIFIKIFRRRASISLLIDLWWRFGAFGPLHRRSEGDPLDHSLVHQVAAQLSGLLADNNSEGVTEMANHLMRRHPAPLSRATRMDVFETEECGRLILCIC